MSIEKNEPGAPQPDEPEKDAPSSPNVALASAVTVVVLAAYVIAVAVLWSKVDSASEVAWSRWTFLLAGLEAPAFAAIGWLFGKEVHRVRAEKAEEGEAEATKKAATEQSRADKLSAAGASLRRALGRGTAGPSDRLGTAGPQAGPDLETLRRIAEAFPED